MPWTPDFAIDHEARIVQVIDSSEGKDTGNACTFAFQKTIDAAIDNNLFPTIGNLHSEQKLLIGANYPVTMERFPGPLFGVVGAGAHMTAFVRAKDGIKIWVPRRSKHLVTYPDMLDTTVAGGLKAEHTPFECIVEEADEEASLPVEYVREHTKAVGVLTHLPQSKRTGLIYSQVLYLYDIELPETIVPKPHDDEVSGFTLMSVDEVTKSMLMEEFKPNSSLVMMDFFARHGVMTPENEVGYAEIVMRLKRRLPVAITPQI
jgi:8-oxo-dGTP pyrophosphatase MutT (NUDIX family)